MTGSIHRNIGILNGSILDNTEQAFIICITCELLHQHLGHIGKAHLERLIGKDLANGIIVDADSDLPDTCEHCIAGKQHHDPFPHISQN